MTNLNNSQMLLGIDYLENLTVEEQEMMNGGLAFAASGSLASVVDGNEFASATSVGIADADNNDFDFNTYLDRFSLKIKGG